MPMKPARRKAPAPRSTSAFVAAPVKTPPRRPKAPPVWLDDGPFNRWVDDINSNIAAFANAKRPLFISTPVDLFAIYLRNLPKEARQHHTCNECRRFINTYGRLLVVNENGDLASAIWHEIDAPAFYRKAANAMREAVIDAGIGTVFYTDTSTWGTRRTGTWTHFAVDAPAFYVTRNKLKTPFQLAAEKREDYKNVRNALDDFDLHTIDLAVALLKSDALYRSEKVLTPAEWLHRVACMRNQPNHPNRTWLAVAQAPAGFCHPRSSMIGSLLDDLKTKSVDAARAAFAAKMHPLQYMRPTAAPSEQTIDRAERIVDSLGIQSALARRIATLADIPHRVKVWVPTPLAGVGMPSGVFASIREPQAPSMTDVPGGKMTWAKFSRDILPSATSIDAMAPTVGNYTVLCTAVDPHAKPIMRWDVEGHRNPFNWYVWHGGSPASQHHLRPLTWVPVSCVTPRPCDWGATSGHGFPPSVLFFLEGAGETRSAGSALFPECLRGDLHEVRSVIERYSKKNNLPLARVGAVALPIADGLQIRLRVTTDKGLRHDITLDRME